MKRIILASCFMVSIASMLFLIQSVHTYAAEQPKPDDILQNRRDLFDNMSTMTGIPWHYFAAIDQFEHTLNQLHKKTRPARNGLIRIFITPERWSGLLNPDKEDTNPASIEWFEGIGKDGDGDGKADQTNDVDVLYTIADQLLQYGASIDDLRIGLWEYYHNSRAVKRIDQFAKVYKTFDTLELSKHVFVLPLRADYSYRSTWGAARGWGGRRIHEGTDIFARHGVNVRSATYGVIEVMGWNKFGGWRIGIRDMNNIYHYYAHLSGFNKQFKQGDVVKPGDIIGWVGSSGYGKPGTQGKFPPHLHYGMYRDNGYTDWSFDPYPHLRKWERDERRAK